MIELLSSMSGLNTYELAGVTGFVFYLAAFGSVQFGLLDGNSTLYTIANILAASLVGISLISDFNLASALTQGSWIMIGLAGLTLRAWKAWPSTKKVLNATLEEETA